MVLPLRPERQGFLRPFGTAQFIVSFLKGESPNGSPKIDPAVGAPQADIHREYKKALHRAFAEDMVAIEEGRRAREELPPLTIEEADRLTAYYLERIPYKLTRMRYQSFRTYFHHLKRLDWVEETGVTEPSQFQEDYPPAPSRVFYRLTDVGWRATPDQLSDPVMVLYHYSRDQRSAKKPKRYTTATKRPKGRPRRPRKSP